MNNSDRSHKNLPGLQQKSRAALSKLVSGDAGLSDQRCEQIDALGPMPRRSLRAFVDLGLTDAEIGRYFKIPQHSVADLRNSWGISAGE